MKSSLCNRKNKGLFWKFNTPKKRNTHARMQKSFVIEGSKVIPPSVPLSLLCLNEDVLVFGVQHTFTDELLSDGDGHVVGHTQVWQVVQKPAQHTQTQCKNELTTTTTYRRSLPPFFPLPCVPGLSVLADQADEGLHLGLCDVFLQQFSVVVQQGSDGVLSQDVVTNLTLHHTELLRDVFLEVGGR